MNESRRTCERVQMQCKRQESFIVLQCVAVKIFFVLQCVAVYIDDSSELSTAHR